MEKKIEPKKERDPTKFVASGWDNTYEDKSSGEVKPMISGILSLRKLAEAVAFAYPGQSPEDVRFVMFKRKTKTKDTDNDWSFNISMPQIKK
jgi:hypothetical protein